MISYLSFERGKGIISSETCTPWPVVLWDISSHFFSRHLRTMFDTSTVESLVCKSVASFWEQNLLVNTLPPNSILWFSFWDKIIQPMRSWKIYWDVGILKKYWEVDNCHGNKIIEMLMCWEQIYWVVHVVEIYMFTYIGCHKKMSEKLTLLWKN